MKKIVVLVMLVLLVTTAFAVDERNSVMELNGHDWFGWSDQIKQVFVRGFMVADYFVLGMLMQHGALSPDSSAIYYLGLTLENTTDLSIMADITRYYKTIGELDEAIWMAIWSTQLKYRADLKTMRGST